MPGYCHDWTINDSRPCLNCEYDLVGQHLTDVCPECGAMVMQSVNGTLLKYSGFSFVKTIQTGARSINWSIYTILLIYAYMIGVFLMSFVAPALSALGMFAGIFIMIGGAILSAYFAISGWWKLTQPDPRGLTPDSGENLRRAVRAALIIYLMMIPTSFVVGFLEGSGTIPAPLGTILAMVVSMLSFTVLLIGTMKYIQRIAYRVPSVKLRKRARTTEQLMNTVILGYIVMLLTVVGAVFMPPSPNGLGVIGAIMGIAGVLVGVGSLLALIYFTVSMGLMGKHLEPVLESSEEPNQMGTPGRFGIEPPSETEAA
ncbi:MAG: hypothetical protein ACF8GE_06040 [Phycisphaerales bacterium JB043]